MVAAAGGEKALAPWIAWSLLSATLAIFVAILWVAHYSTDLGLYPIDKSPEVLEDRARELTSSLGYPQVADRVGWFNRNYEYLLYRNANRMSSPRGQPIAGANPGALSYVYRQSPEPLAPRNVGARMQWNDPPPTTSGMAWVIFDSVGRLRQFYAVPYQNEAPTPNQEPNWQALFQAAGLDIANFKAEPPRWLLPTPFDVQRGWEGAYDGDKTPIHVLGASYHGKPVAFSVITPWEDKPEWTSSSRFGARRFATLIIFVVGGALLAVIALFLVRKNVRLGRGDRSGAFRLAAWYFVVVCAAQILLAHHVTKVDDEFAIVMNQLAAALLSGVLIWIYYVALEPYVRRSWPEYLISWTRLLGGDYRNPMVGRDVLAGCLAGAVIALTVHVVNGLPAWFHLAGQTPINANDLALVAARKFVGMMLLVMIGSIGGGLTMLFSFFVLRTATKRYWAAVALLGVLYAVLYSGQENVIAEGIGAIIISSVLVITLLRFGLLGVIVAYTVLNFMEGFPVALDPSRWYFARGFIPVLIVLALAVYAFRISLGSRPVFALLTGDD